MSSNLYPSWIKTADYGFIRTGGKINSIAISEDSKFLYTSDDSGKVIKYDIATGDSISMIKAVVPAGQAISPGWCVISKDAKSYICLSIEGSYYFYNHLKIYDILTGDLIDSTMYYWNPETALSDQYIINLVFAYYDYKNRTLCWGLSTDAIGNNSTVYRNFTGKIQYLRKESDKWKSLVDLKAKPVLHTFSDTNYLFFNTNDYFNCKYPSDNYYTTIEIKTAYLYDKFNDTNRILYYYKDQFNSTPSGKNYSINSTFIKDDILYLQNGDNLTKLNAKTLSQISLTKIDGYNTGVLVVSSESGSYFIIDGNKIHIQDEKTDKRKATISIDSAGNLLKYMNTPDGTSMLFTDEKGAIIKLDYQDIFRLQADFSIPDIMYSNKDTVKFKNLSRGNPTTNIWDFGDGTTSYSEVPTHVYSDTGYFTVKLIVKKSTKSDTLIKTNCLYIFQNPNAGFRYDILNEYPVKCIFHNTTSGKYDSLLWVFHDGTVSTDSSPVKYYSLNGLYNVTLKIYYKGNLFETTDTIHIYIPETPITDEGLIYEYFDSTKSGFEAIRGFDDKYGNLIYHIKGSVNQVGCINSDSRKWSYSDSSKNFHLFRRNKNLFSIVNDSSLFNIDVNNEISSVNNKINRTNILYPSTYAEDICIPEINKWRFLLVTYLYNLNNEPYYSDTLSIRYFPFTTLDFSKIIIRREKDISYYIYTCFYQGFFQNQYYSETIKDLNGYTIKKNYYDFIRINDEDAVVMNNKELYIYQAKLADQPVNGNIFASPVLKATLSFQGFQIMSIKKLYENVFIITGDSAQYPGYIILNEKGEILRKKIFVERKGSFNFAFNSNDSSILFSGWSYKIYPNKSPYFLKIMEPLSGIIDIDNPIPDSLGTARIVNHYCYPNPGFDEYSLVVESKYNTLAEFRIVDYSGIIIHPAETLSIKKGKNEYKFVLKNHPIGLYLYELKLPDGNISGKIIKLKN